MWSNFFNADNWWNSNHPPGTPRPGGGHPRGRPPIHRSNGGGHAIACLGTLGLALFIIGLASDFWVVILPTRSRDLNQNDRNFAEARQHQKHYSLQTLERLRRDRSAKIWPFDVEEKRTSVGVSDLILKENIIQIHSNQMAVNRSVILHGNSSGHNKDADYGSKESTQVTQKALGMPKRTGLATSVGAMKLKERKVSPASWGANSMINYVNSTGIHLAKQVKGAREKKLQKPPHNQLATPARVRRSDEKNEDTFKMDNATLSNKTSASGDDQQLDSKQEQSKTGETKDLVEENEEDIATVIPPGHCGPGHASVWRICWKFKWPEAQGDTNCGPVNFRGDFICTSLPFLESSQTLTAFDLASQRDWVIAAVVLAALALLLGIAGVVCSIYGIVKQQALATLPYASVGYTFTGVFSGVAIFLFTHAMLNAALPYGWRSRLAWSHHVAMAAPPFFFIAAIYAATVACCQRRQSHHDNLAVASRTPGQAEAGVTRHGHDHGHVRPVSRGGRPGTGAGRGIEMLMWQKGNVRGRRGNVGQRNLHRPRR
uniref:Uncharacterized protein n=1 Tax=Eptatretus burgeri TaxID=7764 RepID=A0A8C4QQ67_EPTBU